MTRAKPVPRPALVRCPLGGYAPCIDDMCHGGDETLCGLHRGFDFCQHEQHPDFCTECAEEEDYPDFGDDE